MPTSCSDLQRMGYKLSGFYSIKGSKKKMEMVYCDFYPNRNDKQKTIGYADIKSAPVYFHVQRNTTSRTINSPIPFEFARVNEGNTMNITSGKFTAPLTGIYFFSITGIWYNTNLRFYLNGNSFWRSAGIGSSSVSLTFQSVLNLKKGDQIWVQIEGNYLADDSNHYTHFTGLMLEEQLADFAIS
ncbi:complement C1q tumor necrosis factor-related protein 3-like [Daphnia pulex]|uniref:complement C1q tumor necrosis factor-related protein 3-like n=1 Tax=Daphnia pulex TaxID=6669 RepID=UPI001EE0BF5E|nr:complement C1q tumor necrosis factor-related protein 3-like [Daphnia pulex]